MMATKEIFARFTPSVQQLIMFIVGILSSFIIAPLYRNDGIIKCSNRPALLTIDRTKDLEEWKPFDSCQGEVKILCFVLATKAQAIHNSKTWLKRCDVMLFLDSEGYTDNANPMKLKDSNPTTKTIMALNNAWEHHQTEVDWFLVANTQTYVVLENLRDFLQDKNCQDVVYYGRHMSVGYVLSKAAVKRLILEKKISSATETMGSVLQKAGVPAGDSTDSYSRELFHSNNVAYHTSLAALHPDQMKNAKINPHCGTVNCTASRPIAFNGVSAKDLYILEYIFYKARVTGRCMDGYKN